MNKYLHVVFVTIFFIVGFASLALLVYNSYDDRGHNYYRLKKQISIPANTQIDSLGYSTAYDSTAEMLIQHRSNKHDILKPNGSQGHFFGILGSAMMIFGVAIYMIRKRVRRFFTLGFLKNWLEFHIFLCTVGPLFVLYHTAFKFGGIVAVSFWSMVAVVSSGFIGRYIYIQIPRTIRGNELNAVEMTILQKEYTDKLKTEQHVPQDILDYLDKIIEKMEQEHVSFISSLWIGFSDFFTISFFIRELKKKLKSAGFIEKIKIKEIIKTAKSQLVLSRRIRLLKSMQRLFKYWHVFHLPFAIAMFLIMILHIGVAITFGYSGFSK